MVQKKRKPRYMGGGIMMRMQFPIESTLVKGDACWDADEGFLLWTGKNWKPIKDLPHALR